METATPGRPLNFYARVIGFIYLFAMALSIFTQMYFLGIIVVPDDAAATARNVLTFEGLYRLAIALDVLIFVTDVIIGWAFYELLKSVDKSLALLGALLRVADGAILAGISLNALVVLRLLGGATYLAAFKSSQLDSLARLFLSVRGLGFYIGFVFLGIGSAVLAYTLLKSRFVPSLLPAWGIFSSLLLAAGSLGVITSAWFADHLAMAFMIPMFFYEVPLGLWFLVKGVRAPVAAQGSSHSHA